jgi:hypothetical protein
MRHDAAASRHRYTYHALPHGLVRVRATLDWIDATIATLEGEAEASERSRRSVYPGRR